MSDAAEAIAVEAPTEAPAAATEETTATEATPEPKPFDPKARNFKADMAARIAAREKAAAEPAKTEALAEEPAKEPEKPKPPQQKPPKNRDGLPNARKAFFQRREAEKAAAEAANQAQSEASKVEQLQRELDAARGFENQYKTLIREGKYDEALKLSGELDGVEALQRRILERENLVPKNDPDVAEMKSELAELKKQIQERERQEAEVRRQARQQAEDKALLDEVTQYSLNHDDETIRKWGQFPGFNEQVLLASKNYPQLSEDQIYGQIVEGFESMRQQLEDIFGNKPAPNGATPARDSAKPEAAPAAKPEPKKLVTVPTNAAESSSPEPFDPMSKPEKQRFREFLERRHGRR